MIPRLPMVIDGVQDVGPRPRLRIVHRFQSCHELAGAHDVLLCLRDQMDSILTPKARGAQVPYPCKNALEHRTQNR